MSPTPPIGPVAEIQSPDDHPLAGASFVVEIEPSAGDKPYRLLGIAADEDAAAELRQYYAGPDDQFDVAVRDAEWVVAHADQLSVSPYALPPGQPP